MEAQASSLLLICLRQVPHLWQCIYFSMHRRWLVLFLRWRLVSRAFNQMILHKDATDPFSRDMFQLLSDLYFVPSKPPPVDYYQCESGLREYYALGPRSCVMDVLRAIEPVRNWPSVASYNALWAQVIEHVGPYAVVVEYQQWKAVRPRTHRVLIKRPAEMDPQAFIDAYRFRNRLTSRAVHNIAFFPRGKSKWGSRCGNCFDFTPRKSYNGVIPHLCDGCIEGIKSDEYYYTVSKSLPPNSKKQRM